VVADHDLGPLIIKCGKQKISMYNPYAIIWFNVDIVTISVHQEGCIFEMKNSNIVRFLWGEVESSVLISSNALIGNPVCTYYKKEILNFSVHDKLYRINLSRRFSEFSNNLELREIFFSKLSPKYIEKKYSVPRWLRWVVIVSAAIVIKFYID